MLDLFRTFLFETAVDADFGAGGADTEASAGAEDVSDSVDAGAAASPPEAPVAPTQAPDFYATPEFQQAVAQQSEQAFYGLLEQLAQANEPEPQMPEIDLFADDAPQRLAEFANQIADQRVQQALAPLTPILDQVVTEKGDGIRNQILDGLKPQLAQGFDEDTEQAWRQASTHLAGAFFDPQRPETAGQAVQQAAQYVSQLLRANSTKAVENYRRQIGEINDAPAEPSGTGGALPMEKTGGSYDEIIERHAARIRG